MSFMLRDINRYQADVSLLCRRIDQLFGRASALDRQHKAKQFIAAESLAEIIKDLEGDLSWYIDLFTVRDVLSVLTYGVDIGCHQGVDCGDHAQCGSSNQGQPSYQG